VFPEEYGGAGLDYISYCIIIEELARIDPSIGLIVAAHTSLCSNHIYLAGTEEQKRHYLPKLGTAEWIGCWSLTEPEAGSDAGGTRSQAVRDGDGWVLNGSKTFCTNAHYAQVCVAMLVTDRAASQHGISAFVLDTGVAGFRLGRKEDKLGMRASATGEVIFGDLRVPASQMLGKPGEGFVDSLRILDGGRILDRRALGRNRARCLRPGTQVFQAAPAVRTIHLRVPGDSTQARQHGDRYRGCPAPHLPRRGHAHPQGRREQGIGDAKLFASEMAVRACDEAVQIHGGYGFIKDYGVEKFYRDVKLCTIGEGTSEIQRLVIARQLLKA